MKTEENIAFGKRVAELRESQGQEHWFDVTKGTLPNYIISNTQFFHVLKRS